MTEIYNHKNLEWTDKTGLCYLSLLEGEDEVHLSIPDYLVIITYIDRNAGRDLSGLRVTLLNKFEEEYPSGISEVESLETYYNNIMTVQEKRRLAKLFDKILVLYKPSILKHLHKAKDKKLAEAMDGLYLMARYVMDAKQDHIPCANLIREVMKFIDSNLPEGK